MSESRVEKTSPKLDAKSNNAKTQPESDSTKVAPAKTQPNQSNSDKPKFKSQDIGKWKSKQENPFAKQNRERQAQKQAREQKRQKIAPLWIALGSVLVTGLAVFGLAALIITLTAPAPDTPPITGQSTEDVISYRDVLQKFYDQSTGTLEEKRTQISQMVQNTLDTNDGKRYANQVKLAEAIFYSNNNLPDAALEVAEALNPDDFSPEQKLDYYNVLYYSYALKNDYAKAQEYTKIIYQLSGDLYGWE